MNQIKVEIVNLTPPVPDTQWRWGRFAFSLMWGMWLGFCVAWCRDTIIAYFLAGLFGALLGIFHYSHELWRRRANYAAGRFMSLMQACNERAKAELDGNLRRMIEHFFEGSPIQNYVIQVGEKGLVVKVGDDDCLVPVDVELLSTDPVAALEQARLEWMSAKAHSDDLAGG